MGATGKGADTFTDVLASVAAQWTPAEGRQPEAQWSSQPKAEWTSSLPEPSPFLDEGSVHGSAHGGNYYHTQMDWPGSASMPEQGTLASMVSGSPVDLHPNSLSYPDARMESYRADSGSEGSARGAPSKKGSKAKPKDVQAERVQQRKSRKREKDKIEELQASLHAVGAEAKALSEQNTASEQELQGLVEELKKLRAAEESAMTALVDEEMTARFSGDVTLTVRDTPTVLSPEQLKALSEDDLAHYWRLYVDKLADLLAEADTRPHGPAPDLARRVQSLQREALFLHIRAAITNMRGVKRFLARGRLEGPHTPPDASTAATWLKVAEGLQLSGEQRQSMTGLWRGFNERMQRILAARHSIHATITSSMPDGIMGRDFARNFLKAHEGMDALVFNLRQEHVVICDFVSTFHQTLTPIQNARFIVSSSPYFPDTVACALWIAALSGDQAAKDRLQAGPYQIRIG
ncbi:g12525 [Coccomyxa viridis]|uniref:G12525 protein n=1 Tax=Coccomyxa viridis TaxID=1274662 RepID=A0ABP1GF75_9CHLO